MGLNKEEMASLARRDPLAFGIMYIDLLESKKWEVATRTWATEIYQAVNPWYIEKYPLEYPRRVVVTKSTQSGISTWAMTRMFHFATNWPVRIFYTLPRQQDVLDFVTTRIDPMIKSSAYLRDKLDMPDSAHAKRIGDSYLFFMELSVEPRMMPSDAIYVDEVDLSNPDFMGTAINRMDASRWKLSYYLSTPTVPNYGIHGLYMSSDQRQWLVKCPSCNEEQPIDWEKNLRIVGAQNNPTKVFYGCAKCNAEITVPHIQTGRWVAQKPYLSNDVVGYHVHQMLTTSAPELYRIFRDPQTTLVEFYRKRLGMPYEMGGGSIERDDFLTTCFDEPYEEEVIWDGQSTYFLGADQGNELQVVVGKVEKDTRRIKVVHVELIPLTKGFDRLAQLIDLFHIRRGVIDGNPNRHEALKMAKRFPGRILVADYIEQKEVYIAKKGLKEFPTLLTNVTINRTTGFDSLIDSIKSGMWTLPGNPLSLSPGVELLIDHTTAIKRDIETRRTPSGEVQVGVWRKLRADHLAHSLLYMKTAVDINRGRATKVAVIGKKSNKPVEEVDTFRPDNDTIKELVSILAEVPTEQLSDLLSVRQGDYEGDSYEMPFPLSYKFSKIDRDKYTDEEIDWIISNLISPKRP